MFLARMLSARVGVCVGVCVKQDVTNMHGYRYRYFICFLLQSNERRPNTFIHWTGELLFYRLIIVVVVVSASGFRLCHKQTRLFPGSALSQSGAKLEVRGQKGCRSNRGTRVAIWAQRIHPRS